MLAVGQHLMLLLLLLVRHAVLCCANLLNLPPALGLQQQYHRRTMTNSSRQGYRDCQNLADITSLTATQQGGRTHEKLENRPGWANFNSLQIVATAIMEDVTAARWSLCCWCAELGCWLHLAKANLLVGGISAAAPTKHTITTPHTSLSLSIVCWTPVLHTCWLPAAGLLTPALHTMETAGSTGLKTTVRFLETN